MVSRISLAVTTSSMRQPLVEPTSMNSMKRKITPLWRKRRTSGTISCSLTPRLSTVLTLDKSDWAVGIAPAMADGFWLRVTVEQGVIRVQYSTDGKLWPLLRLAPFPVAPRYRVGPMCCTPERGGLEVVFSQFSIAPAQQKDLHDLS